MTSAGFQEIFEKCFATLFDDGSEFDDALQYACFGGGKRVRPRGVFLGASAVSATPPLDEVLSLAGAIELIHSYSLVHDDLPAMDNDDYRRGRLTVHRKYGEATGILAGDALLSRAAKVLASGAVQFGKNYAAAAQVMTSAAEDMVRGQVLDLAGMRTKEEFLKMYALKTGALFRAAFLSGAIVAGANEREREHICGYARGVGAGIPSGGRPPRRGGREFPCRGFGQERERKTPRRVHRDRAHRSGGIALRRGAQRVRSQTALSQKVTHIQAICRNRLPNLPPFDILIRHARGAPTAP